MKRHIFLITLLAVLTGRIAAQSVTVDATIDSLQILIGEQAKIKLQVALDADKRAIFPAYADTLVRGVEIIDIAKPDTQMLNDGRRSLITQEYTVTSFDSALYYLPPMEVLVDNKAYRSKALALKVYSMPVDTLHPDQFFGPKSIQEVPLTWEDLAPMVYSILLLIALGVVTAFFIIRYRDNKPIIKIIKVEPKLPPHLAAMKKIETIKADKVAPVKNKRKNSIALTVMNLMRRFVHASLMRASKAVPVIRAAYRGRCRINRHLRITRQSARLRQIKITASSRRAPPAIVGRVAHSGMKPVTTKSIAPFVIPK